MKKLVSLLFFSVALASVSRAQLLVSEKPSAGAAVIADERHIATIVVDPADDSLVQIAARLLADDIGKVTGKTPVVQHSLPVAENIILIGSLEKSGLLRRLVTNKKLSISGIANRWEAFQAQVVASPAKGIGRALVIAGSDRRGTAFGVFELSKQIGVSPWWWWADVPVQKKTRLYIPAKASLTDAPKVKYRGLFINDEAPALSNWSKEKFGGFNHYFYEKVCELLLRLKGNYLWPAMWGNAFYDDDSLNRQTADNYGVVIGTSHHEPLMRAHDEWRRYGSGKWNYDSNEVRLKAFWKEGLQRATNEKIVSVGMRGDGDEPMTQGTAIALLERIVSDQRTIIEKVTGKPASATPQLWALYKEVQDYYDKGMRVPDDVTLLLCDDNWGNLRKLPRLTDKPRSGGYGIYYHFDYVGGPRNYKWINTNNLARVWEQMHLAYAHGVKNIWIVNVGDIKPMELPTSFFLDYAWNPDRWSEDNLQTYYTAWAAQQFGNANAKQMGDVLRRYAQYSARRKPELLDSKTYSLTAYNEWNRVVGEWDSLEADVQRISPTLPPGARDAFFQLVAHPVKAFANLHRLYFAVAKNNALAATDPEQARAWAGKANVFYTTDSLLTLQYHRLNGGKWNHMMDQTHIGYTYWQQPPVNTMPVLLMDRTQPDSRKAAVAERTVATDNANTSANVLPGGNNVLLSIDASHWTSAVNAQGMRWKPIPGIGRSGNGVTTFPVTATAGLGAGSPHLHYAFRGQEKGVVSVTLYFSPTLNFHTDEGLQYAVSIDDEKPQVFSLNKEDNDPRAWSTWVADNVIKKTSAHRLTAGGHHTLKYWAISPAVVLQQVVITKGEAGHSYLAPPTKAN